MTSLHIKKQIHTGVGYMLSNMEFMIGIVIFIVVMGFVYSTFIDGDS